MYIYKQCSSTSFCSFIVLSLSFAHINCTLMSAISTFIFIYSNKTMSIYFELHAFTTLNFSLFEWFIKIMKSQHISPCIRVFGLIFLTLTKFAKFCFNTLYVQLTNAARIAMKITKFNTPHVHFQIEKKMRKKQNVLSRLTKIYSHSFIWFSNINKL